MDSAISWIIIIKKIILFILTYFSLAVSRHANGANKILDSLAGEWNVRLDLSSLKPNVQVIDNFATKQHWTNIFKDKIGNGKLLFSSMYLHSILKNRPAARQLRQSLLNYMESETCDPISTVAANRPGALKSEYKTMQFIMKRLNYIQEAKFITL